jgi:hypothetical protein
VIYVCKNCPTWEILIDSPVYSSPGSRLRKRITSQIFGKNRNLFWACLLGPGEVVDEITGDEKSRDTVPLSHYNLPIQYDVKETVSVIMKSAQTPSQTMPIKLYTLANYNVVSLSLQTHKHFQLLCSYFFVPLSRIYVLFKIGVQILSAFQWLLFVFPVLFCFDIWCTLFRSFSSSSKFSGPPASSVPRCTFISSSATKCFHVHSSSSVRLISLPAKICVKTLPRDFPSILCKSAFFLVPTRPTKPLRSPW